jgi:hypothetical protein
LLGLSRAFRVHLDEHPGSSRCGGLLRTAWIRVSLTLVWFEFRIHRIDRLEHGNVHDRHDTGRAHWTDTWR